MFFSSTALIQISFPLFNIQFAYTNLFFILLRHFSSWFSHFSRTFLNFFQKRVVILKIAFSLSSENWKRQWDFFSSHCLKIVFWLQKRYVIYKIQIFGALKIALKNRWKPWFYWLCGYVIYFDHSSQLNLAKSISKELDYALM